MAPISPTKFKATRYITVYLTLIAVVGAFALGLLIGKTSELKKEVGASSTTDMAALVNIDRTKNNSKTADFNQFWDIWDKIKDSYVKKDKVKDVDMFYGAIQGLVGSLGDPYSLFFPPKAADEFQKSFAGEFEGIGAEIGFKNDQLTVVAPLPGSPAERSGLRPGDKILAIDKTITLGMDVISAVQLIRGPAGSTTTLTISRNGLGKAQDYVITRAKINVPATMMVWEAPGALRLRVMQFNDRTVPEFGKAIQEFKKKQGQKIILDLRGNPGGYLDSAVSLAGEWISEGDVIVAEKFSTGRENKHISRGEHRLLGVKTVVLVNGGSASASEIVAGALQDNKVAIVVGAKTFGKGSVQDFETFSDGSALKITVAEWFTPAGNNINEKGITPDFEITEKLDAEPAGEDAALKKALELLK